jgi:putative redox protein
MVSMHIAYDGQKKSTATHDDSGARLVTDAPKDIGGSGSSFSPTDLVATALATCIVTTMAMFGERHEVDLTDTKIHVTKEMSTETPRRIGKLTTTVTIPSGRIPTDQRALFERVGHSCPVYQSLHPDIETPLVFIYEDEPL